MKFLVAGAAGYLGSRVVLSLLARGHEAVGLVRSVEAADRVRAAGIEVAFGDLAQPSSLTVAASATDGVINTAFGHDNDFMAAVHEERLAIQALIEAMAGTGKRLVAATATGVLGETGPEPVNESFRGQPDFPARARMAVEDDLKAAASRDVRTTVVRPAILVHGHAASQFVPMLVDVARRYGTAGYLGDGANRIATVHVDDLADLFVLAAERAEPGSIYNGAGGDISTRDLAESIAAGNPGVRPTSWEPARAAEMWGTFPALLLGINNRASGERARRDLTWAPYRRTPTLVDDLSTGSYANSTPTAV